MHVLADHAAGVTYAALNNAAREAAKKSLLDTLGVCLAGRALEPATGAALAIAEEMGGAPQATLLGQAPKAPAMMAAFANGALAHALDYDDLTPWGQHCTSSIVPATFAVAERQGGVSGKDLIAAVAVGQDIFARLLRHVGWCKDWNFSTIAGVFAATAAAGRVMGFDGPRMANALGIATLQSAGLMEMVAGEGSNLRGLYAGFSAKGAVLACMMAEQGTGGIARAFEGPNGVMACYFGGGYDRIAILDGLGTEFLGAATLYKRWPCVGTAHSHMQAVIGIVSDSDLSPNDIAAIRLHVGDFHRLMSDPIETRRAPRTLADAKFSLPFLVAVALVRRGMSVHDFTPSGLSDPDVLACAAKMTLIDNPALNWGREMPPGRVEIVTQEGRHWTREGHNVLGSVENPMGWDDICAKFRECAAVAATPLSADRIARAEALARDLQDSDDATALMRLVGGATQEAEA